MFVWSPFPWEIWHKRSRGNALPTQKEPIVIDGNHENPENPAQRLSKKVAQKMISFVHISSYRNVWIWTYWNISSVLPPSILQLWIAKDASNASKANAFHKSSDLCKQRIQQYGRRRNIVVWTTDSREYFSMQKHRVEEEKISTSMMTMTMSRWLGSVDDDDDDADDDDDDSEPRVGEKEYPGRTKWVLDFWLVGRCCTLIWFETSLVWSSEKLSRLLLFPWIMQELDHFRRNTDQKIYLIHVSEWKS